MYNIRLSQLLIMSTHHILFGFLYSCNSSICFTYFIHFFLLLSFSHLILHILFSYLYSCNPAIYFIDFIYTFIILLFVLLTFWHSYNSPIYFIYISTFLQFFYLFYLFPYTLTILLFIFLFHLINLFSDALIILPYISFISLHSYNPFIYSFIFPQFYLFCLSPYTVMLLTFILLITI